MTNRPQTLYGISDSPVGLAAWMLDHDARSYDLIARAFDGQTEGLTRDDILDNVTLYWLTNTAVSSARLYWESKLPLLRSRQARHHPGGGERLSGRDLRGAEALVRARLSQPHPLQPARQRRSLRRLGAAAALRRRNPHRLPAAAQINVSAGARHGMNPAARLGVSRARCSAQRCTAEPGPTGTGSARTATAQNRSGASGWGPDQQCTTRCARAAQHPGHVTKAHLTSTMSLRVRTSLRPTRAE